ncbi:F-box/FBD/LRR-repeat protein At1g13570-like [Rutidosis leptorrhynchoides]|uniref:F-box/FBD/LRR-repeat protein At1g13570-like n=1 Tax=Rutidosis leptorrhynchoides TaxID=125765 RepID=UPI003A998463
MEPVDEKPSKASKFAPENDFISRMPENVITDILDRLPIKQAVRTDILSRNWRYKWTTLTQLEFGQSFFKNSIGPDGKNVCDMRLSRLLLHFKAPIKKFDLYIPYGYTVDVEEFNNWILFVSKKELQEINIFHYTTTPLKLPSQLFTCMELKHMKLRFCAFQFLHSFCGFPNLLSLELDRVKFGSTACGNFIAQCPLLEILKIVDNEKTGEVKFDVLAKLVNLKVLCLSMCVLDNTTPLTSSGIIQLLCLLPKLQELDLNFSRFKFITDDDEPYVELKIPNAFPCLKNLTLSQVDFGCYDSVSFVIEMICGSPTLQKLRIMVTYKNNFRAFLYPSLDFDCNKKRKLQLKNVVIDECKGTANEALLIKYILACSPLLKKIVINPFYTQDDRYKFWLARKLLRFHRVSPVAEIDIKGYRDKEGDEDLEDESDEESTEDEDLVFESDEESTEDEW